MKRTPLKRKTPLKAKSKLTAKTPLRWSLSKTKARKKRVAAKNKLFGYKSREIDEDYLEWIRNQPCVITGKRLGSGFDRVDPAHTDTVGSGGSDRSALPLINRLHTEQHTGFKTFARKYGLDYDKLIREHNERYERERATVP